MVKDNKIEENDGELTPMQLDSLKELGNIGSGHAITALSQLLNRKIDVSLTSVDLVPFWKLPEKFGGRDTLVFGILSFVEESQPLIILQIFEKESLINIVNSIVTDEKLDINQIQSISDIDEYLLSSISEIGNILTGHYASALADLMETKLVPGVPNVAFDTLGAIMDQVIARSAEFSDLMILINTNLVVEELKIKAILVFLPLEEGLKRLFKAIHVD